MLSAVVAGSLALAVAGEARAADRFKVTSVDCETFWLFKRTPVLHYDIVDERTADYNANPGGEYFRQAASRTAEYCDRTSNKPKSPLGPPRAIRGIWFQSNDGRFKALFDLDGNGVDVSAGVVNRVADEFAADQRSTAHKASAEQQQAAQQAAAERQQAAQKAATERQHQAQLDEVRTREARAREIKDAEDKIKRDRMAAENARVMAFFEWRDLQVARIGTAVHQESFTNVDSVRTNPFHYRRLGMAVVRTTFNRMMSEKVAMFGSVLAPIFLHMEDVDRFTTSGETVMLAFRVTERGDVERSYGSIPEIILSSLKSEPLFGEYVGAYSCPSMGSTIDCERIFDVPPPS